MKILHTLLIISLILFTYGCQEILKTSPAKSNLLLTKSSSLDYILIPPKHVDGTKKYPLFIFMHGWRSCAKCTLKANYELFIQQNFYLLIPQAPEISGDGYSWYNLHGDSFLSDLQRSEKLLTTLVNQITEKHNINRSKIILSGFSQGGRLSFYIGLKNPDLFSGIAPIGGAFMQEQLQGYLEQARHVKIFIMHGIHDNVNPFDNVKEAHKLLSTMGFYVTLYAYPLQHTYIDDMLLKIFESLN